MSEQLAAELFERLSAAKFKIEPPRVAYPFQLGWNAAIEFAIKQLKLACDEQIIEEDETVPMSKLPHEPINRIPRAEI